jgi:hypothetical protein
MATVTADRAASTFPVFKGSGAGNLCVAYGVYEHASNLAAATIIEYCKVPAGAVVIGGWFRGDDLDTGTEELDIDIGYAANGDVSADPDAFGNFDVITGDVVTSLKPEVTILYPLNGTLKDGPVTFTRETTIIGTVNVDAATGGTGTSWVCVYYVVP